MVRIETRLHHNTTPFGEAYLNAAPLGWYWPRRRLRDLHFQELLGGGAAQPIPPGIELRCGKTALPAERLYGLAAFALL
jgi:hypothetical protein